MISSTPWHSARATAVKRDIGWLQEILAEFKDDFQSLGLKARVEVDYDDHSINMSGIEYPWDEAVIRISNPLLQSTLSTLALRIIACHEFGHFLGGRPYLKKGPFNIFNRRGSSEGQSDYFSTQVCLPRVLKDRFDINSAEMAALEVARFQAKLLKEPIPDIHTPSSLHVRKNIWDYPSVQCRLDTLIAGLHHKPRPECWFRR